MVSSETLYQEEQASFIHEIEELRHQLRYQGSGIELKRHKVDARRARQAVRPLRRHRLTGSMLLNQFFSLHPQNTPAFRQNNLESNPNHPHEFSGVLTGLADIGLTTFRGAATRRVCLKVAPLAWLTDPAWEAFYRERGWEAKYNHAFGVDSPELAGRVAWIPIDCLVTETLYFPQTPEDSAYVTGHRTSPLDS